MITAYREKSFLVLPAIDWEERLLKKALSAQEKIEIKAISLLQKLFLGDYL